MAPEGLVALLLEERYLPITPPDPTPRPARQRRPWTEAEQARHREQLADWWEGSHGRSEAA